VSGMKKKDVSFRQWVGDAVGHEADNLLLLFFYSLFISFFAQLLPGMLEKKCVVCDCTIGVKYIG